MAHKMGRGSYQKLIDEDIEWLMKQPRTLEREHILQIIQDSVNFYYKEEDGTAEESGIQRS